MGRDALQLWAVFFSYAVVTLDEVLLFINESQLEDSARSTLPPSTVVLPYDTFFDYMKRLPSSLDLKDGEVRMISLLSLCPILINSRVQKILIGDKASLAVADALGKDTYTIVRSPITDLKAIKNSVELEGFRQCHIRDGAALARYFAWLEEQLHNGAEISESQGSDQLEKYRS